MELLLRVAANSCELLVAGTLLNKLWQQFLHPICSLINCKNEESPKALALGNEVQEVVDSRLLETREVALTCFKNTKEDLSGVLHGQISPH